MRQASYLKCTYTPDEASFVKESKNEAGQEEWKQ